MFRDPEMTWDGKVPYDDLAEQGVTPDSTMTQIKDCAGELMRRGLRNKLRKSYDQLRLLPNRLVLDFFLYRIDREPTAVEADPSSDVLARVRQSLGQSIVTDAGGILQETLDVSWLPDLAPIDSIPDKDWELEQEV